MEIGIVGLPRSGKTTIFNALTGGRARGQNSGRPGSKPNLGVTPVRDPRLDSLEELFQPKRTVLAEVTYVDFPTAPEGLGKATGIAGEYLNQLQGAGALLVVVRAFNDPSVHQVQDGVDPIRDAQAMHLELAFADLEMLERRLAKIADRYKGASAAERDALERERSIVADVMGDLEKGVHIRRRRRSEEEIRLFQGFQFLTGKPLIAVVNADEDQASELPALEERASSALDDPDVRVAAVCGTLEMELAEVGPDGQDELRESLGLGEPGWSRMIALSYEASGLITFFTGSESEVRSWAVPRGATALKAAGGIHSDLERGFIRAEVVSFDELIEAGSLAEARRRGVLRQEGKGYVIADGDVVNILFNV